MLAPYNFATFLFLFPLFFQPLSERVSIIHNALTVEQPFLFRLSFVLTLTFKRERNNYLGIQNISISSNFGNFSKEIRFLLCFVWRSIALLVSALNKKELTLKHYFFSKKTRFSLPLSGNLQAMENLEIDGDVIRYVLL